MEKPEESLEEFLFYRNCLDKAAISIFQTDENGTIFYANEFACAGLGYTMEELRSLSVFDIDPAVTQEKMIELKRILDAKGSVTHESIHQRKDGTTFPVEITVNHLEFQGKVYGMSFVKDITERKRTEEELLLTQHCFDNASIAIHRAQPDGKISHANRQMCRNLGYTRAELNSMSVFEIDPAITPEKLQEVERLGRENGSCTFESKHCRKDGTSFPVEITVNYWDINGRKMHMAFVQDITERKRVEEERRKSEENFSIIFQATPDLIAITRVSDGTILEVNEAFSRLLGYSRAEAIGKCTKELSIWADPTDRARWIAEIEATGQVNEFETTLRCRDGSLITCVSTARPLDFGGEKCVLSVVRDITERKQAEEELRKSRQMLKIVLDNFPGVVFWKDRNSVYMGCNKNFSWAAGLPEPSKIVGRSDCELPWKNDAEWYLADDRQVIESGSPKLNIIEPLLHADGHVAWFETSKVPLFDEDGKLFAVLGTSNDITERKKAEEELLKAHAELESRVKERTGQLSAVTYELSLAEERERRRIAGELHDQVGQTLILSKLKLNSISPSMPAGELEALLCEIREHLGKSIEDIRSLTFQLSPPLLYEVGFEAAVEWLADEFEEKFGLKVNFHDDKKLKPLDEKRSIILYQMVRELMINIAKHAEAKSVNITVVKELDNIRVVVADDGKGIDPAMSLRTITITRNGTFGLFNIRHRIEHLGGSLEIESDIGCGTCVSLCLPLRHYDGEDGEMNGNQDHTRR